MKFPILIQTIFKENERILVQVQGRFNAFLSGGYINKHEVWVYVMTTIKLRLEYKNENIISRLTQSY